MHIVLVCSSQIPAQHYGGTERVVQWLAQSFSRQGHQVSLIALPGSQLSGLTCIPATNAQQALLSIPKDADVVHFHGWEPSGEMSIPWLYTLHGNTKDVEALPANTVCISADHARRHGRCVYVYNGIEPGEFKYQGIKKDYLLFFSKIRRRVKGAQRALTLAAQVESPLVMVGGYRTDLLKTGGWWNSWRSGVQVVGEAGGEEKARWFSNAKALLFPIDWEEPFGLVLMESLISGTPVVATPRGSVTELIPSHVGGLFTENFEFEAALDHALSCKPQDCRDWVLSQFTVAHCAAGYFKLYERLCDGENLFRN
jgi:glycosyltransferase involved in cell wall biosynthesis